MLHLLVTGSRTWDNAPYIWTQLTRLLVAHGEIELHHGACPEGTDQHADDWGKAFAGRGVTIAPHPADSHALGKAAGPVRNTTMVKVIERLLYQGKPVACQAFLRNVSRGTSDCAYKALVAGIPVVTHVWNGDAEIRTVAEEQLALFDAA